MNAECFRFEDVELDADRFELRRQGAIVPVQARVLDVLIHLIRNRARLVTRAELLKHVWTGVYVSHAALSNAIMEARRSIGDPADEPRAIITVRGRGYRFVARVTDAAGHPRAGRHRAHRPCGWQPARAA